MQVVDCFGVIRCVQDCDNIGRQFIQIGCATGLSQDFIALRDMAQGCGAGDLSFVDQLFDMFIQALMFRHIKMHRAQQVCGRLIGAVVAQDRPQQGLFNFRIVGWLAKGSLCLFAGLGAIPVQGAHIISGGV